MKLRLIETRLLTGKSNVNAFHGNERTYAIQSRHNSSAKQDAKHQLMFSYLDFRCYFKKVMLKLKLLGSPLEEEEEVPLFTIHFTSPYFIVRISQSIFYTQSAVRSPQSVVFYTDRHKFIHTHNLLQYYKVGDQASVKGEGVEEQMLIFLSSLTPGRVKGF